MDSQKPTKQPFGLASVVSKLPGDSIGCGDSSISYDFLPTSDEGDPWFHDVLDEVCWQTMSHAAGQVPRLVCYQGDIDLEDGSIPVYRHPSDTTLPLMHWSPSIIKIREQAQGMVGHPLNHAFVQLYRGGRDFISEHTDKTLDIVPDSKIVNVSLGAQRTMRLRSKRADSRPDTVGGQRVTERIHMPHNSILIMGLKTNANFLHGIQPDKRGRHELSPAELAFDGLRISITFRQIGTFTRHDSRLIWGQGACGKTKEEAQSVINGTSQAKEDLLKAFGVENHSTDRSWAEIYGSGSNVLNFSDDISVPGRAILFLSGSDSQDGEAISALERAGIDTIVVPAPALRIATSTRSNAAGPEARQRPVLLRLEDEIHTELRGAEAISRFFKIV